MNNNKSEKKAERELSVDELERVAGGDTFQITQDVTVNKAKTADKAYSTWDAYIRG